MRPQHVEVLDLEWSTARAQEPIHLAIVIQQTELLLCHLFTGKIVNGHLQLRRKAGNTCWLCHLANSEICRRRDARGKRFYGVADQLAWTFGSLVPPGFPGIRLANSAIYE